MTLSRTVTAVLLLILLCGARNSSASFLSCALDLFNKRAFSQNMDFEPFWKQVVTKYPEYNKYKDLLQSFPWKSVATSQIRWNMGAGRYTKQGKFLLLGDTKLGKVVVEIDKDSFYIELPGWSEENSKNLASQCLNKDYFERHKKDPQAWKPYIFPRYDRKTPRGVEAYSVDPVKDAGNGSSGGYVEHFELLKPILAYLKPYCL